MSILHLPGAGNRAADFEVPGLPCASFGPQKRNVGIFYTQGYGRQHGSHAREYLYKALMHWGIIFVHGALWRAPQYDRPIRGGGESNKQTPGTGQQASAPCHLSEKFTAPRKRKDANLSVSVCPIDYMDYFVGFQILAQRLLEWGMQDVYWLNLTASMGAIMKLTTKIAALALAVAATGAQAGSITYWSVLNTADGKVTSYNSANSLVDYTVPSWTVSNSDRKSVV
jgi:hypothetical protein